MQITKDKGQRRTDFSEERLMRSINKVAQEFPNLSVTKYKSKILEVLQEQEEYSADGLTELMIRSAVDNVDVDVPDWQFFAARVYLNRLYKEASRNRFYTTERRYGDFYGLLESLFQRGVYSETILEKYSREEIETAGSWIDPDRDNLFTYLGIRSLAERYLATDKSGEVFELPQERFMVIALYLMSDEDSEKRMELVSEAYWAMSNLYMTVATPTFANAGKTHGNLSSCFILSVDDSLDGIYGAVHDSASLSKYGGGIGVYVGNIRSRGSDIRGYKGTAGGTVPFLKLFDATAVAVDQLGVRQGAIAAYQDVFHKDITAFLDLRLNNGDESSRTHNLSLGVNIPDLFMEQVEKDGDWHLFDPHEVKTHYGIGLQDTYDEARGGEFTTMYEKLVDDERVHSVRVKARDIWNRILRSQMETGFPYIMFRDEVNRSNPNKHEGMIYSSNLCVTGDQLAVTDKGIRRVKDLYESGEELVLFDGEKAVPSSSMRLIEQDAQVYKITTKSGREHRVTGYHKIMTEHGLIAAEELIPGEDRIPVLRQEGLYGSHHDPDMAFLLGLYQADGTQTDKSIFIDLWEDNFDLQDEIKERMDRVYEAQGWTNYQQRPNFVNCTPTQGGVAKKRMGSAKLKQFGFEKGIIPDWIWQADKETQIQYIRGLYYCDGTVTVTSGNGNPLSLTYASVDKEFLLELQILLTNMGFVPRLHLLHKAGTSLMPDGNGGQKEYKTQDCWRLIISNKPEALEFDRLTGFITRKGVSIEDRVYRDNRSKFDLIVSVEMDGTEDVYCPTVYTEEHVWVANGFITSNCSEILQNQSPTEQISVETEDGTILVTKEAGDQVVCNLSSITLPRAISVLDRLIPIQVRMLDNVIDLNMLPTAEARITNNLYRSIGLGTSGWHDLLALNEIHWESDEAVQFADRVYEEIAYHTIKASAALAQEKGTYHLFEGSEWQTGKYFDRRGYDSDRWNELRNNVAESGIRNAYLMAVAPTGSTSHISGVSQGLDPIADVYTVIEKKDLMVPTVPIFLNLDTNNFYKPAYQLDFSWSVKQNAARQRHIDQAQSFNIYLNSEEGSQGGKKRAVRLSNWLLEAWRLKNKTVYYTRSQAISVNACVWCES